MMLPRTAAQIRINPYRLNYAIDAACLLLMAAGLWYCWSIT